MLLRQQREQLAELQAENRLLKRGGPGGTSGGMDSVDSKIAAAEARTDTKFAELRADLQRFATKETVWAASGTVLGILLAVAAFAGDRFDAGMGTSGVVEKYSSDQRKRDEAQDQKLDEILKRLPPAQGKVDPAK